MSWLAHSVKIRPNFVSLPSFPFQNITEKHFKCFTSRQMDYVSPTFHNRYSHTLSIHIQEFFCNTLNFLTVSRKFPASQADLLCLRSKIILHLRCCPFNAGPYAGSAAAAAGLWPFGLCSSAE